MNTFIVREVGRDIGRTVEAHDATQAVAEVAGCDWRLVCLPIWEKLDKTSLRRRAVESCYMPRDDSGRQWIVTEDKP